MKAGGHSNQDFKQSEILSNRNAQTNYSCPDESLSTEKEPSKNLKTKFGIYCVQR